MKHLPRFIACLLTTAILSMHAVGQDPDPVPEYVPDYETKTGTELVAVYVGSRTCGPCNLPDYKAKLETMKVVLAQKADSLDYSFSAIGVSKNYDVEDGIAFLYEAGAWDEIVAGRSWMNSAVIEHMWSDTTVTPGMPQVFVYRQDIDQQFERIYTSPKEYLVRLLGTRELELWLDAGAPLNMDWKTTDPAIRIDRSSFR